MKRVFLLGAYGQNNLGDEALLEVFLQQFPDAEITVNSAQPELTAERFGVKSVGTYWNWPPRFSRLRAMLQADVFIFGGGSLLKEIEGGPVQRLAYFARIFFILILARLFGKQTAMLGVGMGPLEHRLYKTLTRLAAALPDLICVRDQDSADLLKSIGVKRTVHVTADAVFTLQNRAEPGKALSVDIGKPYAVVVPRYSLTHEQQQQIAAACDHLVEAGGLQIILLPFQTAYKSEFDDSAAAEFIRQQMRHSGAATVWNTEDVHAAYEVIGKAQMVVSARLHALVFASMQQVPPIALSYEVKVRSFMAEAGQSDSCLNLKELEAGALPGVIDRVWATREEIASALQTRLEGLKQHSRQNFELAKALPEKGGSPLLTAGLLLFISMTLVNAGNYVFNLILGRWLGPVAFADLSLIITLLLMMTFVTSSVSLIAARYSAMYTAQNNPERLAGLRRWLGGWAWGAGVVVMLILCLAAPALSQLFQTASAWPFIILGIGMPIYFGQAVDRGMLQGQTRFGWLALSYQAEMWMRLIGAIVLVALGFAVNGAVTALTLSFVATWWVARKVRHYVGHNGELPATERHSAMLYVLPVLAALIGQIIINNSDILIVKTLFDPHQAGLYAALALIGRIVFFATMSVVTTLFPVVAQRHERGEPHRQFLGMGLGIVAAVSGVIILGTLIVPEWIVNVLFGSEYLSIAPMLWMYALATAFYALANVVTNYWLSAGRGGASWISILGGIAQVSGLLIWHQNLQQIVMVQIVAMGGLLVALLIWDAWLVRQADHAVNPITASSATVGAD
ncbi:MAG: polysaccharide pyruvyl transferase family protein [Anaerolineae bacterium]|nr:polysaccharide pyruvyl transferase family protein [Anaerolineae bacterium]